MKIACICSTKNDGDIIEAFVRLNANLCDVLLFSDESTDKTHEIIGLLAKEGYDLHLFPNADGSYIQPRSPKAYVSFVPENVKPDWIFLLDADEIIIAKSKDELV